MARWLFPKLTDELSAVVSTHGWFEIQRGFTSYAAGMGPVINYKTKEVLPSPIVVYEGHVDDLGLTYDSSSDELIESDDNYEVIHAALLKYLEDHAASAQ